MLFACLLFDIVKPDIGLRRRLAAVHRNGEPRPFFDHARQ
jgi:hypothetical protein